MEQKQANRPLTTFLSSRFKKDYLGNEHFAVIDTETTGFSRTNNDVICLSCEIRNFDFELKDEVNLYAKPRFPKNWSKKAEEIHGITLEKALGFDEPREMAIKFLKFLKPFKHEENVPLLFVSHDLNSFDYLFLEQFFRWEDIQFSFWKVFNQQYKLSTINLGREAGYRENKLNQWAERLKIDLDHHEVESDRRACSKVFKYLVENMNDMVIDKKS